MTMEPYLQLPNRYTPTLTGTEDFATDGDRLIEIIEKYWVMEDGSSPKVDLYQRWFLRHALELFPDDWPVEHLRGRLRYRVILLSIARQNGKSTLAAWLGLYMLLTFKSSKIIGISESVAHANAVVYGPLKHTINASPVLSKKLRATDTIGIFKRDGSGSYKTKPAVEAKLQGLAGSAIVDEIHLLSPGAYDSLVNGMAAQETALLVGLTTAGDDLSVLLKRLYARTDKAIEAGEDERFGAFIYEADPGAGLTDEDQIRQANPAICSGRIDITTRLADVADEPEHSRRRYLLNQFVGNMNAWVDLGTWRKNRGKEADAITDRTAKVWYSVDLAPDWRSASIVAARKNPETGFIETEYVASILNPDSDQKFLMRVCDALPNPAGFIMETYSLGLLIKHLESKGRTVRKVSSAAENVRISAAFRVMITRSQIRHDQSELVTQQMSNGVMKTTRGGEGFRIVSADPKTKPIDALMATAYACIAASEEKPAESQLMVLKRNSAA